MQVLNTHAPLLPALLAFIQERQAIYRRREAGQLRPWTKDPILAAYRFTNVFRELDRTSRWIAENWLTPYAEHSMLPVACVVARLINWPPTLAEIGFPKRLNVPNIVATLKRRRARGEKMVTGAHIVWWGPGGDACEHLGDTISAACTYYEWIRPTLQATFEALIKRRGYGRFLSYEVVTELSCTRWLRDAPDINTWCDVKAGSQRGLDFVMGRDRSVSTQRALDEARAILDIVRNLRSDAMFKTAPLRVVEDSLCEYSKYRRAQLNQPAKLQVFTPDADRPF